MTKGRTLFDSILKPILAAILLLFISVISQAQTGDWIPISPSNTPKWVGHSVPVNNKMYVFSGFDQAWVHTTEKCEVYDPQANQWTYLADMPVPVTHAGLAVDGDLVYIAGGFTGSSANSKILQIYNTATNSWSTGPALPTPVGGNALVRVGRKLYCFGGTQEDRHTGALIHFVLDLEAPEKGWSTAAPMPEPRCHFAAATVAGKIYALGGQVGHDGPNTDVKLVHVYDPATDTWSRLNDMPYIRSHSEPGTFVIDGKITLTGGRTGGENILNTVTTYDPATDTWTEQAPLPLKIFGPSAEVLGNELIVSNGSHEARNNPKTNAWKRSIVRTPQYTLGFAPGQLKLSAALGTAVSKKTLLWSLSGSPAYNIAVGTLPAWLRVSPASGTVDGNGGTEINITADAAGLPVGSYSATVTAQASGYPDAQMVVELTVTQGQPQVLYLYGSIPPGIHDMKLSDTGARGMSQFRTAIEEVGFTLTESLDAQITLNAATLAPYKVLILGSNNRRFTEAERLAVDSWVKAGGGLVAWSDAAFGWQNGGVSSTAGSVSDNDLTQQFGMQFMRDNGVSVFTLNKWAGNHYINRFNKDGGLIIEAEGASPIRTTAPATIIASLPAVANKLNSLDGTVTAADAALSVAKVGQGRVLGVFDRNAFWNAGEGTWLSRVDNKVYAQRLLLWASGVDDTEPPTPPVVASPVADFTVLKNSAPTTLDLSQVFSDNGGAANLALTVSSNTNTAIVSTSLQNSVLTLTYTPEALGAAEITIRATDEGGLWAEDKFMVTLSGSNVQPVETAVHRINAGGIQLTNSRGTFAADAHFTGGNVYSSGNAIAGTDDDAMYQTERTASANNGSFSYNFPVSNGQYKVVLHFADLYWDQPGDRVFDVTMEGALVLDNYDIFKKVGTYTATTETMSVQVADGSLDILFSALAKDGGVDRPKISAIEVLAVSQGNQLPVANAGADKIITQPASSVQFVGAGTDADGIISGYIWSQVSGPSNAKFSSPSAQSPTVSNLVAGTYTFNLVVKDNLNGFSTPDQIVVTVQPSLVVSAGPALFRINAGGGQLTNSIGTFAADAHFDGGYVFSNAKEIADTDDDAMYQTERSSTANNGSFGYNFTVSNGQYLVVLHFADLYWTAAGKRVFDVKAEGKLVLDNYDIIKKVGGNFTATTETIIADVTDGSLDILFSALASEGGVDRPKVSAIEVFPAMQTNKVPTASAGADKNITLPTNSIRLTGSGTDSDGTISGYSWSQVSGPSAATLTNASTASVTASNLVAGDYVFRLTVTDNGGATAFDEVAVLVINASTTGQALASFTLINATTNQDIRTLVSGDTLNLATLPTQNLNIRANTTPTLVGSVKMALTGPQSKFVTESGAPYALFGDNNGLYYSWKPPVGNYTLNGTPYTSSGGSGTAGTPLTINFTVVNQAVSKVVYRINAGGGQLTNSIGTFAADANFNGGYVFTTTREIAGTTDDAMYQTERSSTTNNGSFGYNMPVSNGQYRVVLHFADLYWTTAGKRVFDVKAEGALVLDNYDIIKKVGTNFTATTETFMINVADGNLNLLFSALASEGGVDRPKVSAIEVFTSIGANQLPTANAGADKAITLPANSVTLTGSGTDADGTISGYSWSQVSGPATATLSGAGTASLTASNLVAGTYTFNLAVKDNLNGFSAPDQVVVTVNPGTGASAGMVAYRINAGGGQLTNSIGSFAADAHFNGGYVFTTTTAIAGTDDDAMYQTERSSTTNNGSFGYNVPVSNGQYRVVLHFADLYWTTAGKRVFDVKAEGALVLDNYDIIKKVGTNFTATTETILVNVTDGSLDLLFSAGAAEGGVDRPKVSAIEVLAANHLPTANAGADKSVTLPVNSVTLAGSGTDTDGTISAYSWSQVSGPATATLTNASTASLTASNLVAGSYVFRLTVTDNSGATAFDEAAVTVLNASATGQSLVSFTLMNATTHQPIRTLVPGDTLNLATLPTLGLNIRANTNPATVGSVKFDLTGAYTRYVTENGAPYALFGDNNGAYNSWTPAIGSYKLVATPYTSANASGTAGAPLTINFHVVNQAAAARMAVSAPASPRFSPVVMAYPNPTTDGRFQVSLPQPVAGEISYELTTITGVRLTKGKLKLTEPESILQMDFSSQMRTAGMYYLRLEGGNLRSQIKVVRY